MIGLEALEALKEEYPILVDNHYVRCCLDIIEKKLKALEIILNKKVDMYFIDISENAECYNRFADFDKKKLLEDYEFNLLKEAL